jgi:hypothetical protein
LSLNQLLQTAWYPGLDCGQLSSECPCIPILDEHVLPKQVLHGVNHEQRVAVRAVVEKAAKPCRVAGARFSP